MVSKLKQEIKPSTQTEVSIYGQLDRKSVEAIDKVAEQMLMPRSWVVAQILREWSERRTVEIHELEESWNGSYREEIGQQGFDALRLE